MKEVKGNIWDYYDKGNWIVITTNGTVKSNGECVMGRGVALEAKTRFPKLAKKLGDWIRHNGNIPGRFSDYKLFSFPVKHNWQEKADPKLIDETCKHLLGLVLGSTYTIYMVRPGCGNGHLLWKDVKPVLERYLSDRFVVVNRYL